MKKLLFLAVATLMFAACGNSNNNQEAVETVVEEVAAAVDSTAAQCDSACANCNACDSTATAE